MADGLVSARTVRHGGGQKRKPGGGSPHPGPVAVRGTRPAPARTTRTRPGGTDYR